MQFLKLDGIHFKFSRCLKVSEVQVPELSANNNHIWIVEGTLPGKVHKNKNKNKQQTSRLEVWKLVQVPTSTCQACTV